jgi:hypothetical protein
MKKKNIELIGGPLVVALSEAIGRGCRRPELKRVCAGQGYIIWCIVDGLDNNGLVYKKHVYHLQGGISKDGGEDGYLAVVVDNYEKQKLWKGDYKGV